MYIHQIHICDIIGRWLQDSGDTQVQLTCSSYTTKQHLSAVMGARVFPKVDICVLFPNVFTTQEVITDY